MIRLTKLFAVFIASATIVIAQVPKPVVRAVNSPTNSSTANGASSAPVISADGRYVAFCSNAKDLVPGQFNNLSLDVFLRDIDGGTTVPISVTPAGATRGNGNSGYPAMSSNGQFVAFISAASNLTSLTGGSYPQLFVRNTVSNTTEMVSVDPFGNPGQGGSVTDCDITPDGQNLFIVSSQFLTAELGSSSPQLFQCTGGGHNLRLITFRATNSTLRSTGSVESVGMSSYGQLVYTSAATDLVVWPGSAPTKAHAYFFDATGQSNVCLSLDAQQVIGGIPQASSNVVISADGSAVAFVAISNASFLIYEPLSNRQPQIVASNIDVSTPLQPSGDGSQLLYRAGTNGATNIYLWNAQAAATQTINIAIDASVNGDSAAYAMSADGSRVVFVSNATNLTSDVANGLYQIYVRDTILATTRLVSVTSSGPAPTSQRHSYPAISGDGSRVVFASADSSFVANDYNRNVDVFVWSWATGQIQLMSVKDATRTSATDVGAIVPGSYSVNSNGTFVVFAASDGGLVANDTNGLVDVFVRNALAGATTLASDDGSGNLVTNGPAAAPVVSPDGRYVAYLRTPYWTNLTMGDLMIRDLQLGGFGVRRMFARDGASPSFTADGRYVIYQTTHQMFIGAPGGVNYVYAYDIAADVNILVSGTRALDFAVPQFDRTNAVASPDSQWVTYLSASQYESSVTPSTTNVHLYAHNLASNTTVLVSGLSSVVDSSNQTFSGNSQVLAYSIGGSIATHNFSTGSDQTVVFNATNPSLNRDGTKIAYNVQKGSSNQIYVQTIGTTKSNLVSVGYDGVSLAKSNCSAPILTADGRFVIFSSTATNLVAGDTNGVSDIFIRDLVLSNTFAITGPGSSVPSLGTVNPVVAADGRTIVFQSFSMDLNTNILTANRNLFVAKILVGDSDHDGMDDDWEMTYFGNLSHDGTADTDGDGLTDYQEFLAGTNPIDNNSLLRCLTVATSAGGATIYWSAAPGHAYRIEFKNSIDDPAWMTLVSSTSPSTQTASVVDPDASLNTQRFYRVTALP